MELQRRLIDGRHHPIRVGHRLDQQKSKPPVSRSPPLPLLYLTDRQVRARARQIWLEQGRPEGRELDHWFLALSELSHRLRDQARALAVNAELFEVWD